MRQLLIFLKYPAPGQVKTRLAQAVGAEAAAAIYRACAELTLERLASFRHETDIYVDPPAAVGAVRAWLGRGWTLLPQEGRTLGERLTYATQQTFNSGARRLVVIGTDSPWLDIADIETAFTTLGRADVVLGPTEDGGYYLIGLSRSVPALFDSIPWSSPAVCRTTQERARALGLELSLLRQGYDVDYLEDVQRFIAEERQQHNIPLAVQQMELLVA